MEDLDIGETVKREEWERVIQGRVEEDEGENTDDDETIEQGMTDGDEPYEHEEGDIDCDEMDNSEGGEAKDGETSLQKVWSSTDRRRYICKYCGISRSKKYLIACHVLKEHEDQAEEEGNGDKTTGVKVNTCLECGASFKKPAYLRQHMQSHSLERPYTCPVDECSLGYRRKDHLTRHLLQHKGKLFNCPVETCGKKFSYQGSMKRHVDEFHNDDSPSTASKEQKQHICQELGCGKVFACASKLLKHQDSHVMLDSVEVMCAEPGCMTYFTSEKSLKDHIQSCHLHITCEICGKKHLKKNIKRHLRIHGERSFPERIKCNHKSCNYTFSTEGNLKQHTKALHLGEKPFICNFSGCGMRFAYKHVRDRHEKVGPHGYCTGDFVELDKQFRSRPRGGRKRKYPTVEMLVPKRVDPSK